MKLLLILLAFVGLSVSAPRSPPQIKSDLGPAFERLSASVDIVGLVAAIPALQQTEDGKLVLAYVQGEEFGQVIDAFKNEQEVVKILDYAEANGLEDIRAVIHLIQELLGIPSRPFAAPKATPKTIKDLIDILLGFVKTEQLLIDLLDLIATDPAVQELVTELSTDHFEAGYFRIKTNAAVKALGDKLRGHGFDVDATLALIESIFGWTQAPRAGLTSDLGPAFERLSASVDIVGLVAAIPALQQTEDGKLVLAYVQGEEFGQVIDAFKNEQEVVKILDYAEANGLEDIRAVIHLIQELLGIPSRPFAAPKATPKTIKDLIDILLGFVKTEQLLIDLLDLIATDPAVQELVTELSTDHFEAGYFRIKTNAAVKALGDKLRGHGFDVDATLALIESIFGWTQAPRAGLTSDLGPAFERLSASVDIVGLVAAIPALQQTEDGKLVLAYVQGEEFGQVIDAFKNEQEVVKILDYAEANGLEDIRAVIHLIQELLGIPSRPFAAPKATPKTIKDLIDILLGFVKTEQLLIDLLDLIATDPAVQELVTELSTDHFEAGYFRIKTNAAVKALGDKLRGHGFDVDATLALIESIFGWTQAPRAGLTSDLGPAFERLSASVDIVGLVAAIPALQQTEDGKLVLAYVQGEEFGQVIDAFKNEQEVVKILDYAEANGLEDIRAVIHLIQELLGIPSRPFAAPKATPKTIKDLIDILLGFVKTEQLLIDLLDLIATDPAVQELVTELSTDHFEAGYFRIKTNAAVKALGDKLRGHGFDVDATLALIESIFGWTQAPRAGLTSDLGPAFERLSASVDIVGLVAAIPALQQTEDGKLVLAYVQGEEFGQVIDAFKNEQEVVKILDYAEANGLEDIRAVIHLIQELLGIPSRPFAAPKATPKTIKDLIDILLGFVKTEQLLIDLLDLIATDPAVQELVTELSTDHFEAGYFRIKTNAAVKALGDKLRGHGFDVDATLALIESIFGWTQSRY